MEKEYVVELQKYYSSDQIEKGEAGGSQQLPRALIQELFNDRSFTRNKNLVRK
jgi:hypothetical protein